VRVGEPIDWAQFGPEDADDPDVVRHCYAEVLGRMQADLDDLSAEIPHPIATRAASAVRSAAGSVAGAGRSLIGRGSAAERSNERATGATPDRRER
jgi:hypothetical protein